MRRRCHAVVTLCCAVLCCAVLCCVFVQEKQGLTTATRVSTSPTPWLQLAITRMPFSLLSCLSIWAQLGHHWQIREEHVAVRCHSTRDYCEQSFALLTASLTHPLAAVCLDESLKATRMRYLMSITLLHNSGNH